ncbi:CAP domain-containing protein [Burkholderia pseudomallei]|uniref:CAP domain-containing protein n=1 Tax=Burkholderia pseudomallei TaxID=28450 RepID=UPI002AB502B1|nr:CAP domain-containing protein [Burkholderia pseudomallei]MDY7779542.1 CAP domain-containing protein [Burkholderia pseudomallei]MDY7812345.1 CAP domain-containing protein [Burkholderia pseudomallei]
MRKTAIAATLAAGALAACGGGGGGNGSNGASAPTGSASTPSASNAAVALLAALGASAGAFTATGDVVNDTLAYINHQRAQVGLPALAYQSGVAQAAADHSAWEQDNNAIGHYETAGQAGYTGVSPSDRVNLHYKTSSVGEVTAGFSGAFASSTEPIQALFDAPFHRAIMLFDSVHAGPGDALTTDPTKLSTLTVDFADDKPFLADNQLVAWPYNGMANVDTGWLANESPNPVAAYNNGSLVGAVVGYPVTLSGGDNAAFSNVSFTIADAAGNNVPCVETDSSNNADATREAMCVPIARLAKSTTYTAKVSGTLTNTSLAATAFSVSWTFTTAATDNAPIGAPTSAASAQGASGARAFEQITLRRVILN